VNGEHCQAGFAGQLGHSDSSIYAARPQQGRVEDLWPVRCGKQYHANICVEAIEIHDSVNGGLR